MWFYIILFLCLVFGVVLGLFEGFKILKPKTSNALFEKDPSRENITGMSWDDKIKISDDDVEIVDMSPSNMDANTNKKTLKEKIDARTNVESMVEFNSLSNHEDYQSKIHRNRDKQDDAYNVIKSSQKNGTLATAQKSSTKIDIDEMMKDVEFQRAVRDSMQFTQDTSMLSAIQMQQQNMQINNDMP